MRKFTGGQNTAVNRQEATRVNSQEATRVNRQEANRQESEVQERQRQDSQKIYRRPILDPEQRDPINRILEDQYNYLLDHGIPASKRDVNNNMDQTLLVWEFINGEGTLPRARESTIPMAAPIIEPPVVITDGGRRRKSRKTRKSKRSSR